MSRPVKESEDETEMKVGRRLKVAGSASVVDSPLRRSTRNKQPINQDDGSSPESITSDSTGPPMRSTRRKTATIEYFASDNTRSLRPRKNSTASDTTDNADGDALRDMKKRITRRSVATVSSVETPTKARLRRSVRAGSESNTASPSVRTTRRTRASSVDFEDNNEAYEDKLTSIPLRTPLKTRNRASALPSEPSVVEESDNVLKDVQDCSGDDSTKANASGISQVDNVRSPLLRLHHDDNNEMNGEEDVENTNIIEASGVSIKLYDTVFESPSNESSKMKTEFIGKFKSVSPKVMLHKTDFPLTRNPKNKENMELQTFTVDENSRSSHPNIISQRRSENFLMAKKNQVKSALNRSAGSNLLTIIDCQSSPPNDLAKSQEGITSISSNSLATTNIVSKTNDSKNESIIIIEENCVTDEDKKAMNDDVDGTLPIEHQLEDISIKLISRETQMNNSVMEIDTTADNYLDDGTVNDESNFPFNKSIDILISPSKTTEDVEKSHSPVVKLRQHTIEPNLNSSSTSLPSNKTEDEQSAESLIGTIATSNTTTCGNSSNNSMMESVIRTEKGDSENGDSTRYKHNLSQQKVSTSPNKKETDRGNNVEDDDDVETNVENLFQDILAVEWKDDNKERPVINECENAPFSDGKTYRIVHHSSVSKMVETSENDSDDTVIMQTTNQISKHPEATPRVTHLEGDMNTVSHDDDTEIEQEKKSDKPSRKKSLPKNQNSSAEKSSRNIGMNGNYTNENESQQDTLLRSKNRKNSSDTKSSDSASRRSLDIRISDSNKENKMRRRTIEKMNSVQRHQSREKSIPSETASMDIDENTDCGERTIECSVEASTVSRKQSLGEMVGEKRATRKSFNGGTEKDSINPGLESDTSDSDCNNESKQSVLMPKFLFNVSSSDEDSNDEGSASIDSDIERELNLNGDSISKYSDDNVAGDECRASETENSDDDDGDDDDDMTNFIVDDDEDEDVEEDESSEENVSDNEENVIESESLDPDSHKTQSDITAYTDCEHSSAKDKSEESSTSDEEERTSETNRSSAIVATNSRQKSSPKNLITGFLMETSTPEVSRISPGLKIVSTPRAKSMKTPITDKNTSIAGDADVVVKLIHESPETIKTPAKKLNSSKSQNSPIDILISKTPTRSESFKPTRSKSLTDEPINHSLRIVPIESPEVKQLMSEKLNASLPTLKLQGRILKVSRRSSLMNVEEAADEHNNNSSAESTMERIKCSDNKSEKKKKKKKIPADQSAEDLAIGESSVVSGIDHENIVKKKGKPSCTENSPKGSEEEMHKKKRSNKQKLETLIGQNTVDTEQKCRKKSKRSTELEVESGAVKENKNSVDTMVTMKKSKKDISGDGSMKSRENKPLKLSTNHENAIPSKMPKTKRLSEDLLENLSDFPVRPKKRMKLDHRNIPSRTMFDSKEVPDNLSVDDVGYIPVSVSGGTSQFSVVNLKKLTTKRSKKSVAASTFRERILQRNSRQPISAYLMYQQKMKASGKDKR